MAVVFTAIGQSAEDDAGYEGLDHLEQARHSGHIANHVARLGPCDEHLGSVSEAADAGADSDADAVVAHLAALRWALGSEEVDGVHYRGRDVHESGQHGEGHGEVVPGDGHTPV